MSNSRYTKNGKPRNSGMFKPGVSGNPSGRPKTNRAVQELARTATPQAIQRLIQIALDPNSKNADSLKAIEILFNRGYGRP